jgi:hypothetical protein
VWLVRFSLTAKMTNISYYQMKQMKMDSSKKALINQPNADLPLKQTSLIFVALRRTSGGIIRAG